MNRAQNNREHEHGEEEFQQSEGALGLRRQSAATTALWSQGGVALRLPPHSKRSAPREVRVIRLLNCPVHFHCEASTSVLKRTS
jgi:hypothetical protein